MITKIKLEQAGLKGIWFFGLAGSGKTFASNKCANFFEKSFLIDGDEVRRLISFDLGYSSLERNTQIRRVLGIAQIAQSNYQFPIVSTVTMTKEVHQKCRQLSIEVVKIIRPMEQLQKVRTIYKTDQNVVGKNIKQVNLNTIEMYNNGGREFEQKLKEFAK